MIRPLKHSKPFHMLPLRIPVGMLTEIDAFAEQAGIKTRTQAILALIQGSLNRLTVAATTETYKE